MKIMLIVIAGFIIVVFISNRKKFHKDEINSVEEFHNNYTVRREEMRRKRDSINSGTSKYITKYNSSEDYREK